MSTKKHNFEQTKYKDKKPTLHYQKIKVPLSGLGKWLGYVVKSMLRTFATYFIGWKSSSRAFRV